MEIKQLLYHEPSIPDGQRVTCDHGVISRNQVQTRRFRNAPLTTVALLLQQLARLYVRIKVEPPFSDNSIHAQVALA